MPVSEGRRFDRRRRREVALRVSRRRVARLDLGQASGGSGRLERRSKGEGGGCREHRRRGDEENVSAEPSTAKEGAWLPGAHAHEGGPGGALPPEAEGTTPPRGVTARGHGHALPRADRLRRKRDFDKTYEEGRRLVSPFFVAFVRPKSEGRLRVGVVASRKVGGAVTRNRAKRILRDVFRRRRPKRDIAADVVLVARGSIARAELEQVEAAFGRSLGRVLETIP